MSDLRAHLGSRRYVARPRHLGCGGLHLSPGRHTLGGQERGQEAGPLVDALTGLDARILAMPDNGMRLVERIQAAQVRFEIEASADLEHAVARACELTPPGGVVLLSPAAPSYGHFRDFEERGEAFRAFAGFPTNA